jgi:hypothetical protein
MDTIIEYLTALSAFGAIAIIIVSVWAGMFFYQIRAFWAISEQAASSSVLFRVVYLGFFLVIAPWTLYLNLKPVKDQGRWIEKAGDQPLKVNRKKKI